MFIICWIVFLHTRQISSNIGIFLAFLMLLSPWTQHCDWLLEGAQYMFVSWKMESQGSAHPGFLNITLI